MANLHKKKNLGIHTELLSDGLVDLIKSGAVDNSNKTIDRGKTVATFCMGKKSTYDYLNDNPSIAFKTVDYTNNPLTIAKLENIVCINSALQVDLTGQATADSLGNYFYSGIGGHADFMRGALLAPGGRTVLTVSSRAVNGTVSRIVPMIDQGAGVTLNRGDIHYVVTEYGIAYIHGKSISERAMELIAVSHPKFRPWLIREAKKLGLLQKDLDYVPGDNLQYPAHLESHRVSSGGHRLFMRPVKAGDETSVKELFDSLADISQGERFFPRQGNGREYVPDFKGYDYSKGLIILVYDADDKKSRLVGIGQYQISELFHCADVRLLVHDRYYNRGIGAELLEYLTYLAKRSGLFYFTAESMVENKSALHLLEKAGFDMKKNIGSGLCEMRADFRNIYY
ncbi:MAG TPA: GNAT family N-acetyltransferase [Spirochaetes bacterium]|nr:GNAT family N-acetyltransferase [Spirochaetota bacterium]